MNNSKRNGLRAPIWLIAAAAATWLAGCSPGEPEVGTGESDPARSGESVQPTESSTAATTDAPDAETPGGGESAGADAATSEDVQGESVAPETAAATPAQAGSAFLAENGRREGVVSTASGLQYEVLVSGDGESPGPTDIVTTHYHGTFVDGSVFDSSVERGVPASFPVNRVISAWTEALQLMKIGDKWRLYCPPGLAYGPRGRSGIPPSSTLIFEVELLAVIPGS